MDTNLATSHPANSASSMNIVWRIQREVEVDHMCHLNIFICTLIPKQNRWFLIILTSCVSRPLDIRSVDEITLTWYFTRLYFDTTEAVILPPRSKIGRDFSSSEWNALSGWIQHSQYCSPWGTFEQSRQLMTCCWKSPPENVNLGWLTGIWIFKDLIALGNIFLQRL